MSRQLAKRQAEAVHKAATMGYLSYVKLPTPCTMLKRINVQHVTLGMFLHEFCGSWTDHPFWRTRFLLKSPADLHKLRATSIQEVWIDVRKGVDTPVQVPCLQFDPEDERRHAVPAESRPLSEHGTTPSSTAAELRRAAQVCAQARNVLGKMFNDVRLGQTVNTKLASRLVDDVTESVVRNPHALISLARLKTADDYTYMHSMAVCALMVALAKRAGMDDHSLRQAGMAGLLHDLGKTAIPLEILNKPGPLTASEMALMRTHPREGQQLLAPLQLDSEVVDACLHHHEKIDGSGYPDGLAGEEISLLARMTAICDVYDAITSDRPYKKGWDPAHALRRMAEWSPQHFDQRLFEQFVQTVGIYPLGSLVRLQSQRLAVVVDACTHSLLAPRVKVFYALRQRCRIPGEILDLSAPGANDRIVAREDPAHWDFADLERLWLGFERHLP